MSSRIDGPCSREIRVLHVDDNEPLRDLTAELLEKVASRITVRSESDPTRVPTRVDAEPIDCVVSDYDMPEQNGLELCADIRQLDDDLPFFLFTSKEGTDIIDEAMTAGVTDYIQKEPGVEQYKLLANRVTNAIHHYQARRRLDELESRLEA